MVFACEKESATEPSNEQLKMGRVQVVQNGMWNGATGKYDSTASGRTVVTADGDMLRGATFWCFCFHPNKVRYAQDFTAWQTIKNNHFNAVRLALNFEEPDKLESYPEGTRFLQVFGCLSTGMP